MTIADSSRPTWRCSIATPAILLAGASIGCGGRASVTELSKEQQEYYSALKELLEKLADKKLFVVAGEAKEVELKQKNSRKKEKVLKIVLSKADEFKKKR